MRRTARAALLASLAALAAGAAPVASAEDDGRPRGEVPAYALGDGAAAGADAPAGLADGVAQALAAIERATTPEAAAGAVRRLAGLGPRTLPWVVPVLRRAAWRTRAALVGAIAEMDAPAVTPLLAEASRDPSFGVREAAVVGLGKTGDAGGVPALLARARADAEPSWRVRAAAATALRRAVLRGAAHRDAAAPALVALLEDADPDVARAALAAAAPLALPEALPHVLAVFGDLGGLPKDRAQALTALRAYRRASEPLLGALQRGFLQGADPAEAVRAARARIDVQGLAALDDPEFAEGVLRHLTDSASRDMRDAVVSLGPAVAPWVLENLRRTAARVAQGREDASACAFEPLLDALFQIDEEAGVAYLRDVLGGPDAGTLHRETRLLALRKAQFGFAARMRAELRALLGSTAGRDVYGEALRAVAASGGEDLGALVDAALRDARSDVRMAALDVLDLFPEVPTPQALRELAATAQRPRERIRALASLGRRDPAASGEIARGLLAHPDPDVREAAVSEVGTSKVASAADLLRQRLRDEDGRSSVAARTSDRPVAPAATTGDDVAASDDRQRRKLRAALVRALRSVAGESARADLLAIALGDADAKARETALQELRGIVRPEDADAFVARLAAEQDEGARLELRRLLATMAEAPAARALFAGDVAAASTRAETLRLLAEKPSRVVPDGLEAGLAAWSDDERASALVLLERAGRRPPAPVLAALVRSSRTIDLCSEACRALASDPSPAAVDELSRLLEEEKDPQRRALVAAAVGERRAAALVPALVALLDGSRASARGAAARTSTDLQLYRQCALALGRIGTPEACAALVEHLLEPDLAALGARRSVPANGPFAPEEGAVVTTVRTLVAAAAHADDAALAAAVRASLARRRADGSVHLLDEEYVDGVARYLEDPVAFGLPPRRRTAAALPLWLFVAESAPRWSHLDGEALQRAATELEAQSDFAGALAAYEANVRVQDVENTARSREDRLWEAGKVAALRARLGAAAGRVDEAVAAALRIRDADPQDADLAYLQGWLLVKLGRNGEDAQRALRAALTKDARSASAQFWLAWAVERTEGAERAIPLYAEAMRIDDKRVEDLGRADYLTNRRGRHHRWSHHAYWHARALALAGHAEGVAPSLGTAILLDDRYAAQCLADPAFDAFEDRAAFVAETLARIPDAPR